MNLHTRPRAAARRPLPVVLLVGLLAAPNAGAAVDDSPAEGSPAANSDASGALALAKELYAAGRYLEAARTFEQIWRENARPGALYNAGMARQAAGPGNDAFAIIHWRRYLEVAAADIAAEERADILGRIAAAEERTAAVELSPSSRASTPPPHTLELRRLAAGDADALTLPWPPGQSSLTLHLDPGEWVIVATGLREEPLSRRVVVDPPGDHPLRVTLLDEAPAPEEAAAVVSVNFGPLRALSRGIEVQWQGPEGAGIQAVQVEEARAQWTLPAGMWTLRARAPGFEPRAHSVRVGGRPLQVEVELRRDREARARIGIGAAGGLVGVGLLAGGALLVVDRAAVLSPVFDDPTMPREEFYQQLPTIRASSAGFALLGGGVGATLGAVTTAVGGKERALGAEAALGAVALVAALPVHEVQKERCFRWIITTKELETCYHKGISTAAAVGFGAGLLGTSALALVTRALLRRPTRRPATDSVQTAAQVGPGGGVFMVSGRF